MQTVTSNSKVSQTSIQNWLVNQLSEVLSLSPNEIDITESLTRYGLDSIDAVTLVGDLEDELDMELPDTLFWDHPTIAQVAQFLVDNYDITADLETNNSIPEKKEELQSVNSNKTEKKGLGGLWGKITGA